MAITKEQCIAGTVVYRIGKTAPLAKGTIVGLTVVGNLVIVEWESGISQTKLEKLDIKNLLSETDGAVENQRLLDEQERLKKEFEQVQTECANKLAKAAQLVREAASLAESKGQDLMDMYNAISDFEDAMDEAGWRTSSLHC